MIWIMLPPRSVDRPENLARLGVADRELAQLVKQLDETLAIGVRGQIAEGEQARRDARSVCGHGPLVAVGGHLDPEAFLAGGGHVEPAIAQRKEVPMPSP